MLSELLQPAGFDDLAGWSADSATGALEAFVRSARQHAVKPCASGRLGISTEALETAFAAALASPPAGDGDARAFFARNFIPCRIAAPGFVTAYYEPEVEASPVATERFRVPLLAPPDDLVRIRPDMRPPGFPPELEYGRRTEGGLVAYHDRAAIESGVLGRRARPLAWVESRVDAFFIHVQGAARLAMPDGTTMRVTYAAKSGHPFTGPGRLLVEMGEIPAEEVSMQAIRRWFAANPRRVDEILQRNRSYIFFRQAPVDDPDLGPVAAAKVPLTAGRSLAVDRHLHTFGTPVFVEAPGLTAFGSAPFRRLMVAQDTGSAITGPARGDLFAGSGAAAGEIAGGVRHDATFWALVPCALAESRP